MCVIITNKENYMKSNTKDSLISDLAFKLILESEETEGFEFNAIVKDEKGKDKICNLSKQVILEFLSDEYTKVSVKFDDNVHGGGNGYIVASNSLSNESIIITGLAHHYMALLKMVDRANKQREQLAENSKSPLLTEDFIKELNLSLQRNKEGEVGIGDYRLLDFFGNPVDVVVTTVFDEHLKAIKSVELCSPFEVENEMSKLIEWTNKAFSSDKMSADEILLNASKFQAQFIKIHPFRDGNGRTGRLLTNYLMLTFNQPIISIPIEQKEEYLHALNFINSRDLRESTEDISNFKEFLIDQYNKLFPNNPSTDIEKITQAMEQYRADDKKYSFLTQIFKDNQIHLSSQKVIGKILNNYGQKNLDEHINIGKVNSNQVDYEKID